MQLFPGRHQGAYSLWTCIRRCLFQSYNWLYNLGLSFAEAWVFRSESALLQLEYQRQLALLYPSAFHLSWQAVAALPAAQATRLAYGETAWLTLRKVMQVIQPTREDVFCDLGCGAGRNLFYVRICHGIPVMGIELLPALAHVVSCVAQESGLAEITVQQTDFLMAALTGVTLAYVTANGLDAVSLRQLRVHLQSQPTLRAIISTGKPLELTDFELLGTYRLWFSWGRDWVYLYHRTQAAAIPKKHHLKKHRPPR